jgi:hypothetical protein
MVVQPNVVSTSQPAGGGNVLNGVNTGFQLNNSNSNPLQKSGTATGLHQGGGGGGGSNNSQSQSMSVHQQHALKQQQQEQQQQLLQTQQAQQQRLIQNQELVKQQLQQRQLQQQQQLLQQQQIQQQKNQAAQLQALHAQQQPQTVDFNTDMKVKQQAVKQVKDCLFLFLCVLFLLVNYSSFFVVEVSDLLLLEGCCWTRHLLCLLVRQWQVPKVILLDSNVGGLLVLLQVLMQQQIKQRHAQQQLQQQQQQQQQALKVGSPQLVSSPQIMQAPSPQQQLSPQPDQSFAALPVVTKAVTPPFRTPSPSSTLPATPPAHDDSDTKVLVNNAAATAGGSLQALQPAMAAAVSNNAGPITTPGMAVSPLMADFSPAAHVQLSGTTQETLQAFSPGTPLLDKLHSTEPPLERLMKKVCSDHGWLSPSSAHFIHIVPFLVLQASYNSRLQFWLACKVIILYIVFFSILPWSQCGDNDC